MSDQITHWAESLQVGDKCLATIRHKNDGTKNMHKVEVIIFENNINEQNVCAWFPEFKVILPYNDLSKI